uniref:Uncharacterized protein n=1 Tax=viral metagenome TaxID=1070528 RepID=A0A6C0DCJ3_9ZZZZ
MLLRLERKAVYVDADSWDVGVVLVWLNQVEVVAIANLEAVVAVELEKRGNDWVLAGHALDASDRVARLEHGAVPPVRVVEWLLTLPRVDDVVVARHVRIALDDPDELLAWVVEVQLQLVGRGGDGLTASELQHIDQVLVRDLGELAALIRVEVDVVDVERRGGEAALAHAVADGVWVRGVRVVEAEVVQGVELEVDADLVVLQGNQWQSQTWVAAEPELQWDVQSVHWGARGDDLGRQWLTTVAVVVARRATLVDEVGELWDVADHLGITSLLASLLSELVPNVKPVTVVLVDALTTDLDLDVVDEVVADPVEPAELGTRAVGRLKSNLRQSGLQVHAVDEITVALDRAGDLLAEVGSTVEGVLNRLHREVGVAAIHHLKKRDLWVAGQVYVLGTVRYKLHQSAAGHLSIYT